MKFRIRKIYPLLPSFKPLLSTEMNQHEFQEIKCNAGKRRSITTKARHETAIKITLTL
jgi:hypothetical protein